PRRRVWARTRRPSPRSPPTRHATACRPRWRSGSISRPWACSGLTAVANMKVPGVLAALTEAARARARRAHDALFGPARVLRWRGRARRAGGVGRRLAADGIGPGDRVAITLPNGWRVAGALLGALGTGATVTPLNPALSPDERARTLADLRPRLTLDTVGEG